MKSMELGELQVHMSEVLREVQAGNSIEVTNRGAAVAMLVPVRRDIDAEKVREALASLDELRAEIGKYVTEPTNAAELISEMRR